MANKTTTNLSEKLKAIEVIVGELQKLEEADQKDVVAFALKQLGLEGGVAPSTVSGQQGITSGVGSSTGATGLDMSMDRFVSSKKPADQYQRVAVIAYYLEHKMNKKEFKNAEMAHINTADARQSKIANIGNVIVKAQNRYKFLTKGVGSATHQLSTLGADIVEALPDQDKVKALLAAAKPRKPAKKAKKKAKK